MPIAYLTNFDGMDFTEMQQFESERYEQKSSYNYELEFSSSELYRIADDKALRDRWKFLLLLPGKYVLQEIVPNL